MGQYLVGIIEDQDQDLEILEKAIQRYGHEHDCNFVTTRFTNVENFLTCYKGRYDMIFFDIELPCMNGMDGAKKLRAIDEEVIILFVTNLARYAIEGYQVHAFDYILKPVVYERFAIKLTRVLNALSRRKEKFIVARNMEGARKIDIRMILYVEVMVHTLCYHLQDGGTVEATGKLGSIEKELVEDGFARLSRSYLINLQYVSRVKGSTVILTNGESFELSRNRNSEFKDHMMNYISNQQGGAV